MRLIDDDYILKAFIKDDVEVCRYIDDTTKDRFVATRHMPTAQAFQSIIGPPQKLFGSEADPIFGWAITLEQDLAVVDWLQSRNYNCVACGNKPCEQVHNHNPREFPNHHEG